MNLQRFLSSLSKFWAAPGVHVIVTDPAVTTGFWQQVRARQGDCKLTSVPNTLAACASWYGQMSQSFLGQDGVYWLQTPSPWAPKAKKDVIGFLNRYQGPHSLWMVCDEDMAKLLSGGGVKKHIIAGSISYKELATVADLLEVPRAIPALQHAGVTRLPGTIDLDAACSVVTHAQYVPMRSPETATTYLNRLMPHNGSLLNLSALFFAGRWQSFLPAWQKIGDDYSDMFWVAFWSEQCWRAYWVTHYLRNGQTARARSMAFRLPKVFSNELWRQQRPERLLLLHQRLSFFDTRVKNGSLFTLSEILTNAMNAA